MNKRDEESWYESLKKQCDVMNEDSNKYLSSYTSQFIPFVRKSTKYLNY